MNTSQQLRSTLLQIDHRSYPAYKCLTGGYQFPGYVLEIEHVQGDPFAAPSSLSIHVPLRMAKFPEEYYALHPQRVALQDFLLRAFAKAADSVSFMAKGSGKSGMFSVSHPGQEVLNRSGCQITDREIIVRFEVGFPANGRTINARELEKILFELIPQASGTSLYYHAVRKDDLKRSIELCEDQLYIRSQLKELRLAAFVADGSVLPRESGTSDRPMKDAVPFKSPDSLAVILNLPHAGKMRGMGIPRGVTLIAGGGYHGKSTLLRALERGVYQHIAHDGREYVLTDDSAVKLRAEDGRKVSDVDISMFIRNLPAGTDTRSFSTLEASGSTSQAASIIESIEASSKLLLIDEDTSATNLMVRDELMQRVISEAEEPIVPFLSRVRDLYEKSGISTILVIGSSGSYFSKADLILQMDRYMAKDITARAKEIADEYETQLAGGLYIRSKEQGSRAEGEKAPFTHVSVEGQGSRAEGEKAPRSYALEHENFRDAVPQTGENPAFIVPTRTRTLALGRSTQARKSYRGDHVSQVRLKIRRMGKTAFCVGDKSLDLRFVEQIVDGEQTQTLACLVRLAMERFGGDKRSNVDSLTLFSFLKKTIEEGGFGAVCGERHVPSGLAEVRTQEIYACFDRL